MCKFSITFLIFLLDKNLVRYPMTRWFFGRVAVGSSSWHINFGSHIRRRALVAALPVSTFASQLKVWSLMDTSYPFTFIPIFRLVLVAVTYLKFSYKKTLSKTNRKFSIYCSFSTLGLSMPTHTFKEKKNNNRVFVCIIMFLV